MFALISSPKRLESSHLAVKTNFPAGFTLLSVAVYGIPDKPDSATVFPSMLVETEIPLV